MSIYCRATFNYVGELGYQPVECDVLDGRTTDPGSFEDCGFERIDAPSAVTDWRDADHLDAVHAPEIADLARDRTGCDEVIVYPALVRSPVTAATEADYAPIETVHSDFTDDYRRMIVEPDRPYRAFLDPALHERGLTTDDLDGAERIMMLQFWRNVGPVEADRPLAFCDARSVPEDRLLRFVVPTYGGQRLDFETFLVGPPDDTADRWFTYPQLEADEAVALRTYDSARDDAGLAYWTPHSAFVDPNVPSDGGHRRESIEMRALCLWGVRG